MRIGVLALQGNFAMHCRCLQSLNIDCQLIKKPAQLDLIDGLILPGGESTALLTLMIARGFEAALLAFHQHGKTIFGTCAGAILLAKHVVSPQQRSLGILDITIKRNAYGRQMQSFIALNRLNDSSEQVPMVFIRAPQIIAVENTVTILARHQAQAVLVRQGNVMAATFHPELTHHHVIHRYFIQMTATCLQPIVCC